MLLPATFYHIYNHANGDDNLFREEENFRYFLQQYQKFISPIADTYAYCLMPNHFHFLVRTKDETSIKSLVSLATSISPISTFPKFKTLEKLEKIDKLDEEKIMSYLSKQFSNLFSSYTQAFNKKYERKGSLFMKNFKRKEVCTEDYFTKLIHYIHSNPVHHGFTKNVAEWRYSSYPSFISDKNTLLKREEVLSWFGNKKDFITFHLVNSPISMLYEIE